MKNDPIEKPKLIGVHTLSRFVFCPRAGIITHEQKKDDSGFDTGFLDLSYTPDYDLVLAKQEIAKILRRLESFSLGLLGGTLATLFCGMALKPFLGLLCLLVLIPTAAILLPRLYKDWLRYRHLNERLAQSAEAKRAQPDLGNSKSELIPWYSLLKSFDVERCHDPLIDEELGIIGRPWKLLHRGEVSLPVFFCRRPSSASNSENDPIRWLKNQHFVRMKAYCHLIEKNTDKHSPCGIIVFAGTMNAVALKF